jgi:hypothetical protein
VERTAERILLNQLKSAGIKGRGRGGKGRGGRGKVPVPAPFSNTTAPGETEEMVDEVGKVVMEDGEVAYFAIAQIAASF